MCISMIQLTKKRGETMIKYKIDVLAELKKAGYSTYRLRQENIFGQRTIQQIRKKEVAYGNTLDKICELLNCQPGDILEYVKPNESDQDSNQSDSQ